MPASANLFKLKIQAADFDNTIPSKERVAFGPNVNRVPIAEESATARLALDGSRPKKLKGELRRRRGRRYQRHVIRVPWLWDPDNLDRRRRRGQFAAEDITNCRPVFGIPGSLNAITVNPWALDTHRFVVA